MKENQLKYIYMQESHPPSVIENEHPIIGYMENCIWKKRNIHMKLISRFYGKDYNI